MKRIFAVTVLASALATVAPAANALDGPGGYDTARAERVSGGSDRQAVLTPRQAERILHRTGFAEVADLRLRGNRYVAAATRTDGAAFRITLDARDGSVIGEERIGWARADHHRAGPPLVHRTGLEFRLNL